MITITMNDFKIKQDEYLRQAENYRLVKLSELNRNSGSKSLNAVITWIVQLITA